MARFQGAGPDDLQLTDRFHDPARLFWDRGRGPAERCPGGQLGIDRVALAEPLPRMPVRLVDLDDPDPAGAEGTHESRRVGAGRFDPDALDLSVALQPADQLRVAVRCGWKRGRIKQPSLQVDDRHVVLVGVRIHAANHAASLICHPSLHRPFGSGRQAGTGGHNSDEALAANRFLSSHDRPDRPPMSSQ
jgi:hypothetical protein